MVVAPLSFKDEYGYYGLRVNPSPEQAFGTVRNKLGVPLPDRRWKWYAMSPYRAFLEGQDTQAQAADYDELKYREKNLEVPETATKVKPSEAAHDPAWDRIQRQHENMQERDAYETAFDAMHAEHVGETMRTRAEQLRHGTMVRHNNMHPVVQAAHEELREAHVPHYMPGPLPPQLRSVWHTPPEQWEAGGIPQAPEFQTFEMLNYGQSAAYRPATPSYSAAATYEQMRNEADHTWSS